MKQLPNLTRKEEHILASLLKIIKIQPSLKSYGSPKNKPVYKCDFVVILNQEEYRCLKEIVKNITER